MSEPEKNPAQEVPPEDDGTMSLTAHLEELRSRIIKSLLAVAFGSCVAYFFLDVPARVFVEQVGGGIADAHHVAYAHAPDLERCGAAAVEHAVDFVDAPVINELPMALECEVAQMGDDSDYIVGNIVNVSADDSVLTDGKIDAAKLKLAFDERADILVALEI